MTGWKCQFVIDESRRGASASITVNERRIPDCQKRQDTANGQWRVAIDSVESKNESLVHISSIP
jgi:hypothetical protein